MRAQLRIASEDFSDKAHIVGDDCVCEAFQTQKLAGLPSLVLWYDMMCIYIYTYVYVCIDVCIYLLATYDKYFLYTLTTVFPMSFA